MVCRDTKTQKARKVPRLIVESEEEKALWEIGAGQLIQPRRGEADDVQIIVDGSRKAP